MKGDTGNDNVSRETSMGDTRVNYDFLIIGSGIAGLSFALRVADQSSVLVVTKKKDVDTATNLAQGGIAAVLGSDDNVSYHIRDTMVSGAGLCDSQVVGTVITNGSAQIADLVGYGVDFARIPGSGAYSLGKEGGHSHRRVAHAADLTGREIERALLSNARNHKNINILEDTVALDLIVAGGGARRCQGVYVLDKAGGIVSYSAHFVVLCTGGAGKVYLYTSNPDIATGDGIAMAYRAGAMIANMEFVQFHPTCLFHPKAKNFLISEAVRGEGGVLVDGDGNRFMDTYDSRAELATRDSVARAIDQKMKQSGAECVYLDVSHKPADELKQRFPTIYNKCLEYNIDLTKQPIPVVPAAHYFCGGVLVDSCGQSSIARLLALGETSCTGLHGANRLASNSLLEAVVFAQRAAKFALEQLGEVRQKSSDNRTSPIKIGGIDELREVVIISHNWDVIRRTMWNYVGIVRSVKRLKLAQGRLLDSIHEIEDHYRNFHVSQALVELRNIAHVALLVVNSALLRKESRGLHYCVDYPNMDEAMRYWITQQRRPGAPPWEAISGIRDFELG